MTESNVLLSVLQRPSEMAELSLSDWSVLLANARATGLLAHIASLAGEKELFGQLPPEVLRHLRSATVAAESCARSTRWEVDRVKAALAETNVPVVVLKGTAYLLLELPWAKGRHQNDLDILVPEDRLFEVRDCLRSRGWHFGELPLHQIRYYRRWMHELPLMIHAERGAKLDVHHALLPRIDSLRIDTLDLLREACDVPDWPGVRALAPHDLVLHCALNLFRHGDFRFGLRDLVDLHGLLAVYGENPDFWGKLVMRAEFFAVGGPLFYALRYAGRFLGTRIPEDVAADVERWRPHWPPMTAMDTMVTLAVLPPRPATCNAGQRLAQRFLVNHPLCLWRKTILPKLERCMDALPMARNRFSGGESDVRV